MQPKNTQAKDIGKPPIGTTNSMVELPRGAYCRCPICGEFEWVFKGVVGCGTRSCSAFKMQAAYDNYVQQRIAVAVELMKGGE